MPRELPKGVERYRAGDHCFVDDPEGMVVLVSDLPKIEAAVEGRVREAIEAVFEERLDACEEDALGAPPEKQSELGQYAAILDELKPRIIASLGSYTEQGGGEKQ